MGMLRVPVGYHLIIVVAALAGCATAAAPPPSSSPDFEVFVARQFDFDQPAQTEARFLALASATDDPAAAAEFLTQAARAQGVQDRLEEAQATLARSGAEHAQSPRLRARHALERGRLLRRGGDRGAAARSFAQAYEIARAGDEDALAADATHMLALIAPAEEAQTWVERGLGVASGSDRPVARAWVGNIAFNWAMALSEREITPALRFIWRAPWRRVR